MVLFRVFMRTLCRIHDEEFNMDKWNTVTQFVLVFVSVFAMLDLAGWWLFVEHWLVGLGWQVGRCSWDTIGHNSTKYIEHNRAHTRRCVGHIGTIGHTLVPRWRQTGETVARKTTFHQYLYLWTFVTKNTTKNHTTQLNWCCWYLATNLAI